MSETDGFTGNAAADTGGAEATHVAADSHLTLHYRVSLREPRHEVISTFGSRPATIQMGAGHLAAPLEICLLGLAEGASQQFELDGAKAYGVRHPDLVQHLSRAFFDQNVDTVTDGEFSPGDVVEFNGPGGERVAGVLRSIDAQTVVVDLNHPLAGQAIVFDVTIIGVL